jgi:peptidoglycan/LPS O-acetylase OafA/YrhL
VIRSFATPIGLGAVLALLASGSHSQPIVRTLLSRRWSAGIALGLVALATFDAWPLFATHLTMTALVGACALRRDHVLAPVFEHRVLRHVGKVSYGIYLLNVPVVSALRKLLGPTAPTLLVFAVAMFASVAAATLSFRFVEEPLLAARERFRHRDRQYVYS